MSLDWWRKKVMQWDTRRLGPWLLLVLISLLGHSGVSYAEGVEAERSAQNALHMLDYISVDYPQFVQNGQVLNAQEYQEQHEFAQEVVGIVNRLPVKPQKGALVEQAKELLAAIKNQAPGGEVSAAAHRLGKGLIEAYHLKIAPRQVPNLETAKALYSTHCASCHGVEGKGDGPAAQGLDPAPSNFHDWARQGQRSVFSLFNTITLGVPGTAMSSFQGGLSESQRWALAFWVSTFPATAEERAKGESLWQQGVGKGLFTDLQVLANRTPQEVKTQHGEAVRQVLTYLRSAPSQLDNKPSPLDFSQHRLEKSLEAYRQGDYSRARQLAIEAYLEGFELEETSLDTVDSSLRLHIEKEMMAYRQLIRKQAPIAALSDQYKQLQTLLTQARQRLQETQLSSTAIALGSLTIIVREGLEAVLIVGAILSFLIRSERRDGLVYVHLGWIVALGLGVLTWFAATYFITISGASRELTEGIAALAAAIILLYVGFWLHGKAYAKGWQTFIAKQVQGALNKRTLGALALLSFLAVYREVFETVLFYEALLTQVGSAGRMAVLGGFSAGVVVLVILSGLIFYYSVRLPIKLFFGVTSAALALLAVVLAGKGIGALQEAGIIPFDPVTFPTVPALGIYPNWQGLALQVLLLLLIGAGFLYQHLASRQPPPSAREG